jgi:hypothetical protein
MSQGYMVVSVPLEGSDLPGDEQALQRHLRQSFCASWMYLCECVCVLWRRWRGDSKSEIFKKDGDK